VRWDACVRPTRCRRPPFPLATAADRAASRQLTAVTGGQLLTQSIITEQCPATTGASQAVKHSL
jgi:hypothetical protein